VSYVTQEWTLREHNRDESRFAETQNPLEDAMFEQELELEKRESSIVPLLLIVTLIVGVVAVSLYFVAESRKVLTMTEATPVVLAALDNQGPATVRFQTGMIESASEKTLDPHYRLLEKAGYIKVGKGKKGNLPVSLTPQGQEFLGKIAGVKKSQRKDGNDEYVVPLAQRKLVEVGKITMIEPTKAVVEYSWKWEPNLAGELFDAAGPTVKSFNTWDRATLIDKYGAAFYHAAPTKATMALVKNDKAWQVPTR
jgi:DNA-binding PadR family transcriptional regulator